MIVIMPSSATSTQTFTISIDVELAYSTIKCPITTTIAPAAAYISLSENKISVNASMISIPGNYGTQIFTLTVNSDNFSATVATKNYSFNVVITCAVTSLTITSQVADTTYTLNQGSLVTAAFTVA
jgi:phage baseplate assembly protein gpV